ncbi:HlyD family secretion protein [Selenomonas sp. F0473]|uniref:HlyD family secretion protein n=1 Tax=Selenomonas sp. F0473 TaxID=999423 RepID=UPI000563DEDB|nr:efflux RND transporter periplasmic adaptor subunit [Selenomonas sp. F0473]
MDVDITIALKKYIRRTCAVLFILIVCIFYIIIRTAQTNDAVIVVEGQIMHRIDNILAPNSGTIEALIVEDGGFVEEGTKLMTIRNTLSDEDLFRLQQNVDLSKRNLEQLQNGSIGSAQRSIHVDENNRDLLEAQDRMERMKSLYEMGAISAAKRDEAIANYEVIKSTSSYSSPVSMKISADAKSIEVAERQVKAAEDALKKAKAGTETVNIFSSKAGMIIELPISSGDHVQAGDVLLQMNIAEHPWIEAEVNGEDVDKVYLGQLVRYRLARMEVRGTVQEISDMEGDNDRKRVVISIPPDESNLGEDADHIKLYFMP